MGFLGDIASWSMSGAGDNKIHFSVTQKHSVKNILNNSREYISTYYTHYST